MNEPKRRAAHSSVDYRAWLLFKLFLRASASGMPVDGALEAAADPPLLLTFRVDKAAAGFL